jgi:hypothetical protein
VVFNVNSTRNDVHERMNPTNTAAAGEFMSEGFAGRARARTSRRRLKTTP